MTHLCTGLRPIGGSRFSRPCPRQVRSSLGRCEVCRPAAAPSGRHSGKTTAAYQRERRARIAGAGVPDSMVAA